MHKLSIMETAQAAWNVIRYNWVSFLKMGLGLILAYIGVIVLAVVGSIGIFAAAAGGGGSGMPGVGAILLMFLLGIIAVVVIIAFYVPYAVNVHLFTLAVASGEAPEPAPMIRWRRNEWLYLLWTFLLGLAFLIVAIIFMALFGSVFTGLAMGGGGGAAVGGVIFGFLIMFGLGIGIYYIWARFSFLFVDAAKLGEADVGRSWRQTAPSHFQIFLALVVTYLPFFGVQIVLEIISAMLPAALQFIFALIGIPVAFFGMVAMLVCMALSYHHQVEQQQ